MSVRSIAVVVGNPKPQSRTWDSAHRIARGLSSEATLHTIDLAELGPKLLGWGEPEVTATVETVAQSDIAIFASPTFKATYTGLLKLFLDQFAGSTGLAGVVAVPLQLGAGPAHALSPELHLKPVLVELGATVPTPALYALDSDPEEAERAWLARWRSTVQRAVWTG